MLTSAKIKNVLVLKGIFSETTYVRTRIYQISSFKHISPTSKRTHKKPTHYELELQIQT